MPMNPRPTFLPSEMTPGGLGLQNWYPPSYGSGAVRTATATGLTGSIGGGTPSINADPRLQSGNSNYWKAIGSSGPGGMNLAQFYDPDDYYQYLMEQDPERKEKLKQFMEMKASQKMQQAWQQKVAGARAGGPGAQSFGGGEQSGEPPKNTTDWAFQEAQKHRMALLAGLPNTWNPTRSGGQR